MPFLHFNVSVKGLMLLLLQTMRQTPQCLQLTLLILVALKQISIIKNLHSQQDPIKEVNYIFHFKIMIIINIICHKIICLYWRKLKCRKYIWIIIVIFQGTYLCYTLWSDKTVMLYICNFKFTK